MRQTNNTKNLQKRKTNVENNTNLDYNILSIDKQRAFVSIVSTTSKEDSSTTLSTFRKIKQTKNCQSN